MDWTDRGRVAGVSHEGVADTSLREGYRSICQNKCFDTRAAHMRHSWGPVGLHPHAWRSKIACVACNFLAALDRDPGRRCLRSVTRLVGRAHPARGARGSAARRPREGGRARLVLQPVLRSFATAEAMHDLRRTASASGRGRTVSDRRQSFETCLPYRFQLKD